jgi:nucleotide-binding universal stress UspA family protein
MIDFKHVLFPVDFSSRCTWFAPYVSEFARKFDSKVTLFHALDLYDAFGYGATSSTVIYGTCEAEVKRAQERTLAEFGEETFAGLDVVRVADIGDPAECIVAYAEEHNADVIFMPTHGRGRFRRLLLGSITLKVLHDAKIPVWTSAHCESLTGGATRYDVKRLLCAVDLSPNAVIVLRTAASLADRLGATVRLVHAIPAPEAAEGGAPDEAFGRFLFEIATEQIAARQREAGTAFETCVRHGGVAETVRKSAAIFNADLVIIGRGRLNELFGRLRTNVDATIRASPCPVLSV